MKTSFYIRFESELEKNKIKCYKCKSAAGSDPMSAGPEPPPELTVP